MKNKKQKGYTLLEILVIVVIIGILGSISVPVYNKVVNKSEVSDALHKIDMFSGAQSKYFIQNGSYTGDLGGLETPLKGNSSNISTTKFTYYAGDPKDDNYCIYSQSNTKNYTLARNYRENSEILCSGSDCDKISSFVKEGSLTDLCGSSYNGNCDLTCTFPKILNSTKCTCVCDPSLCSGTGVSQNPSNCQCQCSGNFVYDINEQRCVCPDSVKKGCEDQGKDFDLDSCDCVGGGSSCGKTEKDCKDENENWILLEGCTCGCPKTEECQGGKIWNSTKCECEEQQTCTDEQIENCSGSNLEIQEDCSCKCGLTEMKCNDVGKTLDLENCQCVDPDCGDMTCDGNKFLLFETCQCECTETPNCDDDHVWDTNSCSCVNNVCSSTGHTPEECHEMGDDWYLTTDLTSLEKACHCHCGLTRLKCQQLHGSGWTVHIDTGVCECVPTTYHYVRS